LLEQDPVSVSNDDQNAASVDHASGRKTATPAAGNSEQDERAADEETA
jgi:hypothetical protein